MLTDQQHPITPPPELVQQWCRNWTHAHGEFGVYLATQAARWGADQELEACCQALFDRYVIPTCMPPKVAEEMRDWLRAVRRPKPPSLAEQALDACERSVFGIRRDRDTIRRALERLQELESNG